MRKKGKSGRSIGKPGRNEELRNLEEGLPRLIEENWKRAARSYQATSGVGCDGFHSKAPPDLLKETMRTCFLRSLSSVGEMAGIKLARDVLFDSEELHERTLYRASAHLDSFGGSRCVRLRCRDGRKAIVLVECY